MNTNEANLTCLFEEYINVTDHIYNLLIAQYTIGAAVIAIITGIYLSNLKNKNLIRVFLPFIIVLIYISLLINYNEIMGLGGYKTFLAEQINELLGAKRLTWQMLVNEHFNNSLIITNTAAIIYFGFLIYTIYDSIINVKKIKVKNKSILKYGLLVVYTILVMIIIITAFQSLSLSDDYYDLAMKILLEK